MQFLHLLASDSTFMKIKDELHTFLLFFYKSVKKNEKYVMNA